MPQSFLTRIAKLRILGKSPTNVYLRMNQRIWNHIPFFLSTFGPILGYFNFVNTVARAGGERKQALYTVFFRNRPELELVRRLATRRDKGSTLKIAVVACSFGAEAYSIIYTIRSARPDLKIIMRAVDISEEAVKLAEQGEYSARNSELMNTDILKHVSEEEMCGMFDRHDDKLRIKSWIKEGIIWHVADAGDPALRNFLEPQDIVVASNFLCHMDPPDAERCLRNIGRIVKPGGYLFVAGVDTHVRTKVARDLRWEPVQELIENIHEGDPILRRYWPGHYSGLEPCNKKRRDWMIRYAAVFRLGEEVDGALSSPSPTAPHYLREKKADGNAEVHELRQRRGVA